MHQSDNKFDDKFSDTILKSLKKIVSRWGENSGSNNFEF